MSGQELGGPSYQIIVEKQDVERALRFTEKIWSWFNKVLEYRVIVEPDYIRTEEAYENEFLKVIKVSNIVIENTRVATLTMLHRKLHWSAQKIDTVALGLKRAKLIREVTIKGRTKPILAYQLVKDI